MRTWWRVIVLAAALAVLGWIPLVVGWGHLPDPAATHWSLGGRPDGWMPRAALPWLVVVLIGLGLFASSLFRREGKPSPEAMAMVGVLGTLGVVLTLAVVILNWDVPDWENAGRFGVAWLAGVLTLAGLGGWLGYLAGKRWYPPSPSSGDLPRVEMAFVVGEKVSWVGKASVRWPLLFLGGSAVLVLLIAPPGFAALAAILAVFAVAFSSVEVTVDRRGVITRLLGVRVKKIGLDRVEAARPIDLEPAAWGGWGWRLRARGSAIVLRRGDALEVSLVNGRRFAVTVDDAATGAAVLNGLVSASRRSA